MALYVLWEMNWGAGCTFPSPQSFQRKRSDLSFGSCWQPGMGFQPSPEQIKAEGKDSMYGTGGGSGEVGVRVRGVCVWWPPRQGKYTSSSSHGPEQFLSNTLGSSQPNWAALG